MSEFVQPRVKAPDCPRNISNSGNNGSNSRFRQKKKKFYVFKNDDNPNIREIIQSVANGLDVDLIAPQLYPRIISMLRIEEYKMRENNPSAAASLLNAIEKIENYKVDIESKSNNNSNKNRKNKKNSDEDDENDTHEKVLMPSKTMIDDAVNMALEGKDLGTVDPQLLQFLLKPLKEIKKNAIDSGDYKMAQKADIGTRLVSHQQVLQAKIEEQDEKDAEYQQRLEIAQIQLDNIKEKWQILIEQRKQLMEEDLIEKQNEFNEFLEEYDKQFENEPPSKVLKLSSMALDLKAKEKFLISAKRFDDAKKMRQIASVREKQELKMKKEQYYTDLMKEREKLIEKEKQKVFFAEMNWQTSISQMQLQAKQEITQAQKTVDHLLNMTKTKELESSLSNRRLPPLRMSKEYLIQQRTNTAI
ncbi:hypothetical protein TRFO_37214 [Tritrichomonas foetus]|uniref:Uncharacterized protein n=1 Tax=Tritrichomonas foetus TaxID=1144522 RepID=A0A1J4JD70_9EUKA|nr:hypothetical protein TRFO_37214 [Tritrichomonas foetus]|eukprot:OHS96601.1 hypothetical protein TRFO_37214 [Tritrichomonas foetus]